MALPHLKPMRPINVVGVPASTLSLMCPADSPRSGVVHPLPQGLESRTDRREVN